MTIRNDASVIPSGQPPGRAAVLGAPSRRSSSLGPTTERIRLAIRALLNSITRSPLNTTVSGGAFRAGSLQSGHVGTHKAKVEGSSPSLTAI